MVSLSLTEKKVLSLLELDCRLPANQLAKKLCLSPEGVLKIIRRLKKANIISRFNVKINYSKMGYSIYPVHIKLLKSDPKIKQFLKVKLQNTSCCSWFAFCEGEYDLLLSFKIKSSADLNGMKNLLNSLSDYILEKEISIVSDSFEINQSFFNNDEKKSFLTTELYADRVLPSEIDYLLIQRLKQNSRISLLELKSHFDAVSAKSLSLRIKKLKETGVITGFKTKINMSQLGYHPCIALISLNSHSSKEFSSLKEFCIKKEGINYVVRQIGAYDLELTIDAKNINNFYDIMDELKTRFAFIKKITTLISTDES